MAVLVTGAAGFIGFHVAQALLARGARVVGIDNVSPYYDPLLKEARLAELGKARNFTFARLDIADADALAELAKQHAGEVEVVVHLAAQAGVRHSLTAPFAYTSSNVTGQLSVLEACRHHLPRLRHLVYASTSSVYGANDKVPFAVEDRVDRPVSLYAATKCAGELMTMSYSHLFRLPATGLRFFTVYGPWGRPDMAAWLFTDAILAGRPVQLFNRGEMERDFTYVDDVVAGTLAAVDRPPTDDGGTRPHRLYNLGNDRCVELRRFLAVLEEALGKSAVIEEAPMQPGDVPRTWANIDASRRELGYDPQTTVEDGLPRFVAWYRAYRGV